MKHFINSFATSVSIVSLLAVPFFASAQTPTYWCGSYYSTYPCNSYYPDQQYQPYYNNYSYYSYPYSTYYYSYQYPYYMGGYCPAGYYWSGGLCYPNNYAMYPNYYGYTYPYYFNNSYGYTRYHQHTCQGYYCPMMW